MNSKYLLLLLSIASAGLITAKPTTKALCTSKTCGKTNACSCYCSIKCGPREVEPSDTPEYDEETGQCFCAPRDKALYKKNGCHLPEEQRVRK